MCRVTTASMNESQSNRRQICMNESSSDNQKGPLKAALEDPYSATRGVARNGPGRRRLVIVERNAYSSMQN